MKRAVVFVLVAACAKLVGIHDQQPVDATGGSTDGDGPPVNQDAPLPAGACGSSWGTAGCVTSLVAGVGKTCAVAGNTVYCWGLAPGNGSNTASSPTMIAGFSSASSLVVVASSSGEVDGVTCFDADGQVSCWGDSTWDQLGFSKVDQTTPVAIKQTYRWIAAGADHMCGISGSGVVSCWGADDSSQLGIDNPNGTMCGGIPCSATPVVIAGLSPATAIAAGDSHTCALHADETVDCWGSNSNGQIGNAGNGETIATPTHVVDPSKTIIHAKQISAGSAYSCALDGSGNFACWGAGSNGQLGNGGTTDETTANFTPPPSFAPLTAIATGERNTCAIDSSGAVWCWGDGTYGVAGSAEIDATSPTLIAGVTNATLITVGQRHACALVMSGDIFCWGDDTYGELGSNVDTLTSCGNHDMCSPTPSIVPPP